MHDDYMTTQEVADFIGVHRRMVEKWRKKGWLMPDVIGHGKNGRGGVYYYSKERILQLASVYRKKNCDQTATTCATENCDQTANESELQIHTKLQPSTDTQSRITATANFFNLLYDKITEKNFSYLITFRDGIETYSFSIADKTQRIEMAVKAIELSNKGFDVWHAVNPVCVEPTNSKRGDELAVSYQTAIVVDIDIQSDAHKSDNLAADFDEAKSFLPFTPSIIINSGYGLHAYFIFDTPIAITDQNREELKRRNNLLLDIIRLRANGKKIDGVGDLPRVLRTPGTFNYKLGKDDAPLCHIVEDSGLRFSPNQIDEKLSALVIATPPTEMQSKTVRKTDIDYFDDNPDLKEFRIRRMLDYINVVDGEYEKWLGVGIALFNEDMDCSLWENWSRTQPDFKEGECEHKWNGFHHDPNGISIASLYQWATEGGYVESDIRNEWKNKLQNASAYARISSVQGKRFVATEGILHSISEPLERSCFSMGYDNKSSPQIQDVHDISTENSCTPHTTNNQKVKVEIMHTQCTPTPRIFEGKEYYGGSDVAKIIGVNRTTVLRWHTTTLNGCPLFPADKRTHDGVYLYEIERVMQLKEVYRRDWETAWRTGDAPNDHQTNESNTSIDSLKIELRSVKKALADFDSEKKAAIELLKNVDTFDSDSIFSEDVLNAAAFAKLFDKKVFSDFKSEITLFNRKTKEKKASVNEWSAVVRDKAADIFSRQNDLLTRHNEILAQIRSLSFVATNDNLQSFSIPAGYSVSNNGIEKVTGESMISVCRRPVIIKAKNFSVDEKIFKLILAYMTQDGKLETLPPTEAAIVFNRNKLVDLANNGLPVTSSNANLLVDYLDAFNADNEKNIPLTYTVPRCGWYTFNSKDSFIDPRRQCAFTNEDKNINVVVDSLSLFANSLIRKGKLKDWIKAYQLAKKSPVARIMIAAAIAPILLKILGERNFLLYICAPTRAGKTTALYLAASAIGDDKIIRSFDATKNGLAGAATDVNDFAFLIDEKQVADSKLKEQLDTLVYALANGLGRTKLNKDSTLKKLQNWRTIAIMTGETQLLPDNVTGGANTRLLSINVDKEILSASTCRIIHDTIKDNCGLAFPLVIDKIFQLGFETLRETYKDLVDLFTAKYPELLNEYCRYMAVLILADAILNAVLNDSDTLPLNDAIQNANIIFKLIPTNAEISDTAREKIFVISIIAQNQNRFIGGNVPLDRMQTICGKLKDHDSYTYIAAKFLQDECERNGFDYHKLVSDLVAAGFFIPADTIETGKKSTLTTVQKKIGKVNTRCYRINNDSLNDGE